MSGKLVYAVLGAGNGGLCAAAELTLKGLEVRLGELPDFSQNIEPIIRKGGINLRGVAGEGFFRPSIVTTDIQRVVTGADIILLVVPAMGHKPFAKACSPYLQDGQIIVLTPGSVGGALEFRQVLKQTGSDKNVILAETLSLMYAVKKENENSVWARGLKENLPLAAIPANKTAEVLAKLRPAFPQFVAAPNILEVSLHNLNPIAHPPTILSNIGLIQSTRFKKWFIYSDGYSQGVGKLADSLDRDRMALIRAFGLQETSLVEWVRILYGHQGLGGDNLYEVLHDSSIHGRTLGPKTTQCRELTEDIPYGLVPLTSLAKVAGVKTPVMDALITISGSINGTDYRKTGRTVENLGLSGMSVDEIKQFAENG